LKVRDSYLCFENESANILKDSSTFLAALLKHPEPCAPFLPFLKGSSNPDDPLPLLAALVLAKLLSNIVVAGSKSSNQLNSAITSLFSYLSTLSKSSDAGHQDIAVQAYSSLLRTKTTRELFWAEKKDTVDPLFDILRAGAGSGKDTASTLWSDGASSTRATFETGVAGGVGIQLLYRVLLVIWQLSFEGELVGDGLQE
jgi:V-type H+-transporting ATPase subunit H